MNDALWDLLTDEELAEQQDQWRYAAEEATRHRQWGRAKWCTRMSASAGEALQARLAARRAAAAMGEQLCFTEREFRRVFDPGNAA